MSNNVVGLDKLLNKLNKLGGNVDEVLYKSMQQQGELVKGNAKDLAPDDTGDLRQSIRKETKRYRDKIVAKVYTNSDHAAYMEFGTGQEGAASPSPPKYPGELNYRADWVGVPAQPYLYPALKNNEEKIVNNIKEDVKKAIREVVKK